MDWTDPSPRRRFKWNRPFRRKTNSGICACAITFGTSSTNTSVRGGGGLPVWRCAGHSDRYEISEVVHVSRATRSPKHVFSDTDSILRFCVLGAEVNFHVLPSGLERIRVSTREWVHETNAVTDGMEGAPLIAKTSVGPQQTFMIDAQSLNTGEQYLGRWIRDRCKKGPARFQRDTPKDRCCFVQTAALHFRLPKQLSSISTTFPATHS